MTDIKPDTTPKTFTIFDKKVTLSAPDTAGAFTVAIEGTNEDQKKIYQLIAKKLTACELPLPVAITDYNGGDIAFQAPIVAEGERNPVNAPPLRRDVSIVIDLAQNEATAITQVDRRIQQSARLEVGRVAPTIFMSLQSSGVKMTPQEMRLATEAAINARTKELQSDHSQRQR